CYQSTKGMRRFRAKWHVLARFRKCQRCIVAGHNLERVPIPKVNVPEFGTTDAGGVLEHACKYGLKITAGAANNLQYLRRCRLLFQQLGEFARTPLFRIEEASVLDRDHCLISEGFHQLDLHLGERAYGRAL